MRRQITHTKQSLRRCIPSHYLLYEIINLAIATVYVFILGVDIQHHFVAASIYTLFWLSAAIVCQSLAPFDLYPFIPSKLRWVRYSCCEIMLKHTSIWSASQNSSSTRKSHLDLCFQIGFVVVQFYYIHIKHPIKCEFKLKQMRYSLACLIYKRWAYPRK